MTHTNLLDYVTLLKCVLMRTMFCVLKHWIIIVHQPKK